MDQPKEHRIELNNLAIEVDGERYIFQYTDSEENRKAMLETLSRFSRHPELNFTAIDAARVAQGMKMLNDM